MKEWVRVRVRVSTSERMSERMSETYDTDPDVGYFYRERNMWFLSEWVWKI